MFANHPVTRLINREPYVAVYRTHHNGLEVCASKPKCASVKNVGLISSNGTIRLDAEYEQHRALLEDYAATWWRNKHRR